MTLNEIAILIKDGYEVLTGYWCGFLNAIESIESLAWALTRESPLGMICIYSCLLIAISILAKNGIYRSLKFCLFPRAWRRMTFLRVNILQVLAWMLSAGILLIAGFCTLWLSKQMYEQIPSKPEKVPTEKLSIQLSNKGNASGVQQKTIYRHDPISEGNETSVIDDGKNAAPAPVSKRQISARGNNTISFALTAERKPDDPAPSDEQTSTSQPKQRKERVPSSIPGSPKNKRSGDLLLLLLAGSAWGFAGWQFSKAVLFLAMVTRSRTHHDLWWSPVAKEPIKLFPSQYTTVNAIINNIKSARSSVQGVAVGVSGSYGSSKSFLLAAVRKWLYGHTKLINWNINADFEIIENNIPEAPDDVIAARISIWEVETEADIQYSIFRDLLLHPRFLLSRSWNRMLTPTLAFRLLVRAIRHLFTVIRFKASMLEMDISTGMPMLWQGHVRKLVSLARADDCTILVILDEIDRGTPKSAQIAMQLLRRSLDLPGVVTVIPYVSSQIQHKAFSPLICEMPDLRATIDGILLEKLLKTGSSVEIKRLRAQLEQNLFITQDDVSSTPEDATTITNVTTEDRQKKKKSSSSKKHSRVNGSELLLHNGLTDWYLQQLENGAFKKIVPELEEKYLAHHILISPMTYVDMALIPLFSHLIESSLLNGSNRDYYIRYISALLAALCSPKSNYLAPSPIKEFRSFIARIESRCNLIKLDFDREYIGNIIACIIVIEHEFELLKQQRNN